MPCSTCHTSFPQLTTFGRLFKASGYALTGSEVVSDKREGRVALELNRFAPLGVQLIASYTDVRSPGERPRLYTLRASGDVYWDRIGLGAGVFRTGSTTSTSFGASGSADTTGGMAEVILRPWDNATFRGQYTHYTRLDGASSGASDADAFALIAWVAY